MQVDRSGRVNRNARAGFRARAKRSPWGITPAGEMAPTVQRPVDPCGRISLLPKEDTLLSLRLHRAISRLHPGLCPGRWFHRRGLLALASGDAAAADRWFEAGAEGYRRELEVAPLARLRIHQLMAHACAAPGGIDSAAVVDIVRRLNRLEQLERLTAPFDLADARVVLGDWLAQAERGGTRVSDRAKAQPQAA